MAPQRIPPEVHWKPRRRKCGSFGAKATASIPTIIVEVLVKEAPVEGTASKPPRDGPFPLVEAWAKVPFEDCETTPSKGFGDPNAGILGWG